MGDSRIFSLNDYTNLSFETTFSQPLILEEQVGMIHASFSPLDKIKSARERTFLQKAAKATGIAPNTGFVLRVGEQLPAHYHQDRLGDGINLRFAYVLLSASALTNMVDAWQYVLRDFPTLTSVPVTHPLALAVAQDLIFQSGCIENVEGYRGLLPFTGIAGNYSNSTDGKGTVGGNCVVSIPNTRNEVNNPLYQSVLRAYFTQYALFAKAAGITFDDILSRDPLQAYRKAFLSEYSTNIGWFVTMLTSLRSYARTDGILSPEQVLSWVQVNVLAQTEWTRRKRVGLVAYPDMKTIQYQGRSFAVLRPSTSDGFAHQDYVVFERAHKFAEIVVAIATDDVDKWEKVLLQGVILRYLTLPIPLSTSLSHYSQDLRVSSSFTFEEGSPMTAAYTSTFVSRLDSVPGKYVRQYGSTDLLPFVLSLILVPRLSQRKSLELMQKQLPNIFNAFYNSSSKFDNDFGYYDDLWSLLDVLLTMIKPSEGSDTELVYKRFKDMTGNFLEECGLPDKDRVRYRFTSQDLYEPEKTNSVSDIARVAVAASIIPCFVTLENSLVQLPYKNPNFIVD